MSKKKMRTPFHKSLGHLFILLQLKVSYFGMQKSFVSLNRFYINLYIHMRYEVYI